MDADRFAVVEMLGHRRFGARISEVEMFGAKLMRAEILGPRSGEYVAEQFVSANALYAVTIVTENHARTINTPWQLRTSVPMLPAVDGFRREGEPDPRDASCDCDHDRGAHGGGDMECGECDCVAFRLAPVRVDRRQICLCGVEIGSHENATFTSTPDGWDCGRVASKPSDNESDPTPMSLPVGEDADLPF